MTLTGTIVAPFANPTLRPAATEATAAALYPDSTRGCDVSVSEAQNSECCAITPLSTT